MISPIRIERETLWGGPFQLICIVAIGAFLGAVVTVSPFLGGAVTVLAVGFGLLTLEKRLVQIFMVALFLGLAGYMFLGRGFAYAGLPPLFVGELLLGLAVLTGVYTFSLRYFTLLYGLIAMFVLWGLIRTLPYILTYGIDALRDAVVWGYALFALVLAVVVTPRVFERLVAFYARVAPYFLAWVPIIAAFGLLAAVPLWPQSGVPIAQFKQGDMAVHVAGIIILLACGMYDVQRQDRGLPTWSLWILMVVGFGFIATSRAGLLTVTAAVGLSFFLWPTRRFLNFIAIMVVVGGLIVAFNPNISVGGYSRQVGPSQVIENVNSIVGSSDSGNLEGTKKWREEWWGTVWDYTVNGPYLLTGKGFGVNLAVDDGFEVFSDPPSRSPHSGHVTILARMGLPGLSLWVAIQLVFGFTIYQAFSRARHMGAMFWARLDTCILIYWLALLINMSFDVFLEGPQGGIWYWSVIGLGMAALRLQSQSPQELQQAAPSGAAKAISV